MSIAYHDDLQTFLPNDFRFDYNRIVPVSLSLVPEMYLFISRFNFIVRKISFYDYRYLNNITSTTHSSIIFLESFRM